jgi:hypothetical protein
MDKIQIGSQIVWYVAPDQRQAVKSIAVSERGDKTASPRTGKPYQFADVRPTVLSVAQKLGLKVGGKDVREVGHGDMPTAGQPVEVGKWLVMQATDYSRIVPQEAIEVVQILLDEGVEIKGLLIADDLRTHRLREFRQRAIGAIHGVRTHDWTKVRTAIVRGASAVASLFSGVAKSLAGGMKRKANEIGWNRIRAIIASSLKVMGIAALCICTAVVALPLLVLMAVPAALVTLDPWLLVVDSENRWFVVAEWWD